jgi:hypothetical protein
MHVPSRISSGVQRGTYTGWRIPAECHDLCIWDNWFGGAGPGLLNGSMQSARRYARRERGRAMDRNGSYKKIPWNATHVGADLLRRMAQDVGKDVLRLLLLNRDEATGASYIRIGNLLIQPSPELLEWLRSVVRGPDHGPAENEDLPGIFD